MTSKDFKVVLCGAFGSGRSTFASRIVEANKAKKKIASLKMEVYPVHLHTSAGAVTLNLHDSTLHAKGGIPDREFFKEAAAGLVFYDISKQDSYDALEPWYDALHAANSKRGSAPLPIIIVGAKLDLSSSRAVSPKAIDFARKRSLPYVEISSKGNYKVKELVRGVVRALVGTGAQLTDEIEFAEREVEVDEGAAEKAKKEYEEAMKTGS